MMNKSISLDTKLVGNIEGKFFVPSYQRGYRWGEDEVTRLLDDIYQNGEKNYCLQPVVVRRKNDCFELIDGQQRLTTLYLIYKYIGSANPFYKNYPRFSLEYDTRKQSGEFLKNLDFSRKEENIDFWFITNAFQTIKKWFEKDLEMRVTHLFQYLKENVKIIWYEVDESEDPITLFTRLNIGKIPLTSAELVKAMFLSNVNNGNMRRERQEEIALQWDNIEKELHNNALWGFLKNDTKHSYKTRIDLVLDLISGKSENSREKYDTFFKFEEMYKRDNRLDSIWRRIQHTFLILKDWFENHELYHKIGYLIASNALTLSEIYHLSENQTKSSFIAILDAKIKESIKISGNYAELSYTKTDDYKRISRLLLLFNVESVRQNGEHTQWFPFNKFKYNHGNTVFWSLEHIHAQQSEGMRTQEVWKEWIRLHIPSIQTVANDKSDLIILMQKALDKPKLEREEFEIIQKQVLDVLSVSGNIEYMHSIANLALLNTADNAALNNSTFDVKRNEIINMDKKGQYIPFCTKMVFLKYYTPSEKNQLHFWGQPDRIAYVEAINKVLAPYLDEAIIIEKENVK